ncbi:DUF2062 domain-containing protein [Roseicyclus mahoneyensis]|uniref:DUF2062 domain-containing protein n=1 Tax=Roseicyclus mahoneyensis TaxID=164332 RepID=A0A316GYG4_9RHOB|nr:DUF2062 domain-containing protein [Roseicyclus mahoneyensis]PWK60155.1 hypothetical protein C7455_105139 [Roseicyclus mahoneyensis]
MFKRRDPRTVLRIVAEAFWPRGGWLRAAHYVKHRMRRLPGTPEQIARGVFAGAFTVFTPFFGLHFLVAAVLAKMMRGSILAALLATFIGNPLTYVPIAYISLKTGHWMLGTRMRDDLDDSIFHRFSAAAADLWYNFLSIFTEARADWSELARFYDGVFFPWMVGSLVPGLLCGVLCYYLTVPVIHAYQKRRAARLRKKMEKLRAKAGAAPAEH